MEYKVQVESVTKSELFAHLDEIIDKRLALNASKNKNKKLSIKEVAEHLGVVELTVYNYIKKGILPAFKIGRRVYVKQSDLDNALSEVKSLKYKR